MVKGPPGARPFKDAVQFAVAIPVEAQATGVIPEYPAAELTLVAISANEAAGNTRKIALANHRLERRDELCIYPSL
jgi:hypothetical protein